MNYDNIKISKEDSIALITINRPEKLNALNTKTIRELFSAFKEITEDENIHGLILTGAGEKAFVAGADIRELSGLESMEAREFAILGQQTFSFIENMDKPVIAAVNGFALGGGCELAMACHIRIASDNASFSQPEVNLGLIPGFGGTQRLPRLVGKGMAMEMILSGNMIDAEKALKIGLVNKVVPIEKLIDTSMKLIKTISQKSPVAVKLAIEAINNGLEMPLDDGLRLESALFGLICSTEDKKEGTSAFLEKRKPEFKGR